MFEKRKDSSVESQSREIESNLRKSEHWSNFGTLTSLVSTAAYFFENTFGKNLPRWLNITTLAAVGVGIMGVLASYYYKLKASNIALYSPAHIVPQVCESGTAATPTTTVTAERQPEKIWVEKEESRALSPSASVRY